jgi:hypothetical protein
MAQPPFNLDKYEYQTGGYYDAFKRDVDEKICAAMVSESVARRLREEGLVFNTNGSIPVADIGCGPADSIQMYLEGIEHEAGFNLHVTDYSQDYTGPNGIAHRNLTAAKSGGKLKINDFLVTNGDAFNGKLNATLGTMPNYFPAVFMSHVFYHAKPDNIGMMLSDVSHNLLTAEGVGILFHLENKPDSFQYFRSKYGSKSISEGKSDTPAVEAGNPPGTIETACQEAGIPCYTARYNNNYYFAPMDDKHWEMFTQPGKYHTIIEQAALDNLRKLYFIPQRAANEFAADSGTNGLAAFVDEVRAVIAPKQTKFEIEGGFMALAETVQLIGSARASRETQDKLARVMADIQAGLSDLEQQSFRIWQRIRLLKRAH